MSSPSPSDPDLWTADPADFDIRDVEDEDEPEPDFADDAERTCVECEAPVDDGGVLCDECESLVDATRGDLEEGENDAPQD
jgi:hypothetical protein